MAEVWRGASATVQCFGCDAYLQVDWSRRMVKKSSPHLDTRVVYCGDNLEQPDI